MNLSHTEIRNAVDPFFSRVAAYDGDRIQGLVTDHLRNVLSPDHFRVRLNMTIETYDDWDNAINTVSAIVTDAIQTKQLMLGVTAAVCSETK